MPYPPTAPPTNRLNTTPMVDNHPSDHNMLATALLDLINMLGSQPQGADDDLEARLARIEAQGSAQPGAVMWYAPANTPKGRWLRCLGGAYSRTGTYAKLFSLIGTTYGNGNGSSTFNVPNLADRVVIEAGSLGSVGDTGGSKNAIVVSHSHKQTKHTHSMTHEHSMTHDHPNAYTSYEGDHRHWTGPSKEHEIFATPEVIDDVKAIVAAPAVNPSGAWRTGRFLTDYNGEHRHTFNVPKLTANTGGSSAGQTGDGSANGSTDNTETSGSSGTNKNMPPYLVMRAYIAY